MKITKVQATRIKIPLVKPYICANASLKTFDDVLIRIWTDEGLMGVGESDPIPAVSEETTVGIVDTITHKLAPVIVGKDPFDLELINEEMDKVVPDNLHAKAGIDMALWDLKGKALGFPVYKLLAGEYKDMIPVDFTVGINAPESMAEEALRRVNQGYSTLVLNIGLDPLGDVERMRKVRDAVGDNVKLRLDANEGYRADQAIRVIRKLERYDPELVEQPVKRWDLKGMKRIAKSVDVPISADESNTTLQSAWRLLEEEAADILNIKITKNGGLTRSMKIANIAEAAGIPCLVGGMNTYEVTRQASRHFAASIAQVQRGYASEGCGPASQALVDNITKTWITYKDVKRLGGYVKAGPEPGLGTLLDEEKIKKYRAD